GLKGQPEQPDGFPLENLEPLLQLLDNEQSLAGIDFAHGDQETRLVAVVCRHRRQGGYILGKATASPADPGLRKRLSYAMIQTNSVGHSSDIRPGALTNVGDLVDEADLGERTG